MNLPEAFCARMKMMLGDEYEAFLSSSDRPSAPSLRLNPLKKNNICLSDISELPCVSERVPWAENGYYYDPDSDIRPGKHPYHESGAYYIQEASAMLPASLFPPSEGDKVLDLCAAPGGKSTQLAASLNGTGLLVSNEIHPSRAAILSQNIERMGIKNAVVVSHSPKELTAFFADFFDKIVVDAPCSGEGMFRKEEQALTMWSQENVDLCADRQKDILESAAKMLAPGGYLTYSTCTFAPEENEGVILHFLRNHPEFEVVLPKNPAVIDCIDRGLIDRGNPDYVDGNDFSDQIIKTLRIFPHHANGEGHFAALVHKSEDAPTSLKENRKEKKKNDKRQASPNGAFKLFLEFINNVTAESLNGAPSLFGEQLYLCPNDLPSPINGLKTLRHGLHLGRVINGNRFEPSHSLSLALDLTKAKAVFEIDFSSACSYLRGEVIPCGEQKGWHVVTHNGFPLGWGKASDGMMKNHYPKGLRKP